MSYYILHRANNSLGPSFDEAARRIKESPDVGYIDGSTYADDKRAAIIVVQAEDTAAEALKKSLVDWTVYQVPKP
jgi:hypothetical protein